MKPWLTAPLLALALFAAARIGKDIGFADGKAAGIRKEREAFDERKAFIAKLIDDQVARLPTIHVETHYAPRENLERLDVELLGRATRTLRGKKLACWCSPGAPCHADVLLEIANRPHCEEVKPSAPRETFGTAGA